MITLAPISENIQNTLNEKKKMLSGGTRFQTSNDANTPISDGEQGLLENYMFARTPWLRMTSFLPKNYKNAGEEIAKTGIGWNPVILMGGEFNDYGRLRAGFESRQEMIGNQSENFAEPKNYLEYAGLYIPKSLDTDFPSRPIAGVKDISVNYKGGGMKIGSTRSGEINWTCWSWKELERLSPHFLSPGKTVLLEWGWTGLGKLKNVSLLDIFQNDTTMKLSFNPAAINDLNSKIAKHIQDQNGHYDAILGLVQNFTWSVNENGGFDCTTNIISPGVTLMQVKGKTEKWKNFDSLPLLKEQTSDKNANVEELKESQMKELSKISPYITFRDYMSDFGSQIFHTFNHKSEEGDTGDIAARIKKIETDMEKIQSEIDNKGDPAGFLARLIIAGNGKISSLLANNKYLARTSGGVETAKGGGTPNWDFPAFTIDRFKVPSFSLSDSDKVKIEPEAGSGGVPQEIFMHKVSRVGAYHFVTWGWFEDNVLSRFFGKIGDSSSPPKEEGNIESPSLPKRVISEFRSIEQMVDIKSGRLLTMPGPVSNEYIPVVQSTRFRNSRYLVTLDTAKWIIPNQGDPFWGFVHTSRPDLKSNAGQEWIKEKFFPYTLSLTVDPDTGNITETADELFAARDYEGGEDARGIDHMDIRSILFNAEYLSKMAKKGNDMKSAVLSIWDDFSREYGGVYKFKIEFDDDTKRMMVREEGYTQIRVHLLLANKKKELERADKVPIYPNVYEFPIMEDGSIVKSQNITAKLPQRMQVSAMYGSRGGLKSEDKAREAREQEDYDQNVGRMWGELQKKEMLGLEEENAVDEAIKQSRFDDLLTGDIDYPSRLNREFGKMNANINQGIFIGNTIPFTTDGGFVDNDLPNLSVTDGGGTKIQPSILQDITDQQKIYIQEKKNIDFKKEQKLTGKEVTISDLVKEQEFFEAGFAAFDARKKQDGGLKTSMYCYEANNVEEWSQGKVSYEEQVEDANGNMETQVTPGEGYIGSVQGYKKSLGLHGEDDWELEKTYIQNLTNEVQTEENIAGESSSEWLPVPGLRTAFLTFKHTLRHSLIKLLRADAYGILANIDPLIPIDFEMEIDGTGGIFPGNSFHSSYLSDIYRTKSIFQMVGVDHKIDSSGWFTTVKGQIRSTSELPPFDFMTDEQKDDQSKAEEKAQEAAIEASELFVKFQNKRLQAMKDVREAATNKMASSANRQAKIGHFMGTTDINGAPLTPPLDKGKRPIDKCMRILWYGLYSSGAEYTVYQALKMTYGITDNQDALQSEWQKYQGVEYSLEKDLDKDFDNFMRDIDEYTQVAVLAGYKYDGFEGRGWGEEGKAANRPPLTGPWMGLMVGGADDKPGYRNVRKAKESDPSSQLYYIDD